MLPPSVLLHGHCVPKAIIRQKNKKEKVCIKKGNNTCAFYCCPTYGSDGGGKK